MINAGNNSTRASLLRAWGGVALRVQRRSEQQQQYAGFHLAVVGNPIIVFLHTFQITYAKNQCLGCSRLSTSNSLKATLFNFSTVAIYSMKNVLNMINKQYWLRTEPWANPSIDKSFYSGPRSPSTTLGKAWPTWSSKRYSYNCRYDWLHLLQTNACITGEPITHSSALIQAHKGPLPHQQHPLG